jgi:hypothetical protein
VKKAQAAVELALGVIVLVVWALAALVAVLCYVGA